MGDEAVVGWRDLDDVDALQMRAENTLADADEDGCRRSCVDDRCFVPVKRARLRGQPFVISPKLVPEVFRDVLHVIWLIAVAGHVLAHADARGERRL